MTEPDLKQKEKDEALQRRKEELEAELDRYAQAGAFSPGLIKITRWISRGLYLAMAVAFMVMLINGWGSVSKEDFERASNVAARWKEKADSQDKARSEAEGRLIEAEIRAARLEQELAGRDAGAEVSEAAQAQAQARNLVERAWGEKAYAEHWRVKLAAAPGGEAKDVSALISQAANAAAGERFELMRETAEFGAPAIEQAARQALDAKEPEVRKVAVRLLARLGTPVEPKAGTELDEGVLRELWFNVGLTREYYEAADTYYPEAFVGLSMSLYPRLDKLDQAYRNAPAANRLELLALFAECAARDEKGLMKMVATSQRPLAEKIIAVRWMGARKDAGSRELLKSLSEGDDVLASEAKQALTQLGG